MAEALGEDKAKGGRTRPCGREERHTHRKPTGRAGLMQPLDYLRGDDGQPLSM